MDLTHFNPPPPFLRLKDPPLEGSPSLYGKSNGDLFTDPVCNLNLKETCEFVKSLPVARNSTRPVVQRRAEGPPTPLLSFNHPRKSFPSKWDDAEKWVISHHSLRASPNPSNQSFNGVSDKFTDNVHPMLSNMRYSEPSTQGFVLRKMKDAGTETTPTSRCKMSSPAHHNTPSNRSGLLAMENCDSTTMEVCNLAKLQLGTQYASNWTSKQEEEEQISTSLRHLDWEQEEKTKCCLRYRREEAKIQAWVNLQNAKAEAQSTKLEVKIEKMRSDLEEKLMKRMCCVRRKAEEQLRKMMNRHSSQLYSHSSCGCFPCNT